jgi:hypothetical protein
VAEEPEVSEAIHAAAHPGRKDKSEGDDAEAAERGDAAATADEASATADDASDETAAEETGS